MKTKKIQFNAVVTLPDDCQYVDDGTIVPALREAFYAMMVKGLFDPSFSPSPHLPFEPTWDGAVSRYTNGAVEVSELRKFTGKVDDKYEITVDIEAKSGDFE